MPNPYFVAFEILMSVLFIACFSHAWRKGLPVVWKLIAGVLFGLLLEWATIQQLQAYEYGRFLLMLGEVPLMIGVGWGVIIYSVRLFSDATSLVIWLRPVLDGLLALNIDLAMDAVAIRLGMWDWGMGFEREYFGVPYANFWAWFWVVFSFSMGLRLFERIPISSAKWLAPPAAVLLGVLGVLGTNAFIVYVVPPAWYVSTVAITLGGALLLILGLRPDLHFRPVNKLAFWVPFGFHAYFLLAGLVSRTILDPPYLLVVSVVMASLAVYLHRSSVVGAGWEAA